jgi:hypothetical protein
MIRPIGAACLADPIGRHGALWVIYAPQIDADVERAFAEDGAPSFGAAGDP